MASRWDVIDAIVSILSRGGRDSSSPSSSSEFESWGLEGREGEVVVGREDGEGREGDGGVVGIEDSVILDGKRDRVYVGRRFRNRPRSGTKREFWTLFRVFRVETWGSVGGLLV